MLPVQQPLLCYQCNSHYFVTCAAATTLLPVQQPLLCYQCSSHCFVTSATATTLLVVHILAWGHQGDSIQKQQKAAMRIIHREHFLAHSDPLFKKAHILKFSDIYLQSQLKILHRHRNGSLPVYINSIPMTRPPDCHDHDTRFKEELHPQAMNDYGSTTIRYTLPELLNTMPSHLSNLLYCTSSDSLAKEFKKITILNYSDRCTEVDCYPCEMRAQWSTNLATHSIC